MSAPDPIAFYRALRAELGEASVSSETCAALLAGLDAWERGNDLAASLGLVADPLRFSLNARHGMRLNDRDAVLQELASRATGSTWRRSQTVAGWLTRHASGDRLPHLPADTVRLLDAAGPLSARQIHRILSGCRSA